MTIIPALTDKSVEIFVQNGYLKAITDGRVYDWSEFPAEILEILSEDLHNNAQALELLNEYRPEERLRIYTECKFGGFNATPDIGECGTVNAEHWDCNCEDCPLSPILRGVLQVDHGILTAREIEIIKLIARGYLGKQISAELGISEHTINTHKRNIFQKVGVVSSLDLALWANQIHLI